ncbi:MAG: tetratricopeptide repeat protein [Sedimentisphaerales bacterium]|nr:tetratricopeptide repeat protein [Sedimentisphaerales bacterium]
MNRKTVIAAIIIVVVVVTAILVVTFASRGAPRVEDVLAVYQQGADYSGLTINYPGDGTLFPPEIVAPTFRWTDANPKCAAWLVRIEVGNAGTAMSFLTRQRQWTPSSRDWEAIKTSSLEQDARVTILGVASGRPPAILTGARVSIRTSKDEVGAPLFYREVNLPFVDAVKDPSFIRWRFGAISSPQQPPIVLQNLPVCGNCHSFSKDGGVLAMDVDYANSKGSYVITRVQREMTLATSDIITWDTYRKEDGEQTFGLLSQISPDGRYVISTVKDKSVFVPQPALAFSQLFFPLRGILCVYDRQTSTFRALPGADDPRFVQSNPAWSPDGKSIVFARAEAYDLKDTRGQGKVLLTREECKEFVEDGKPFLFDLYRILFNDGQGGAPEPIQGASNNGVSNFFARYSPDGRWIVFCKARSYMLLQPDSELYIIPAEGGEPRRLRANTSRMNSWHSWSPNGKWLVFSSKAHSDYTQLCLTHIDENGESTPAVLLDHLTAPDRAANIPEFVNAKSAAIVKIREQFLNDYSFVRAGNEFFNQGEADNAIAEYNNALELNPDNVMAHHRLGFLLYQVKGKFEEGMSHLLRAYQLDAQNPRIQYDLGMAYMHQGKLEYADRFLSEAIRGAPDGYDTQYEPVQMRLNLAHVLIAAGKAKDALAPLADALRRSPNHPEAHYRMALALADLGRTEESLAYYNRAVSLNPRVDTSAALHHLLATGYLQARKFQEALEHEEKALALARNQGDPELIQKIEGHIQLCKRLLEASK